jgi:uncharacterized membrane-anchored protein YitT (DUF2179 family)
MIPNSAEELVKDLNNNSFGTTNVHADGSLGRVDLVYTIVNRKDLAKVEAIIKGYNPNAFYTIEEVKKVNKGIFPKKEGTRQLLDRWRLGR